tara:strand:+ start:225 stop:1250 length:1026 start_codon:yes stop_codon:yes gene_type:complete
MTTVVIGNPIRNLRVIIDQIFQGVQNLFFDKEGGADSRQTDSKAKGVDAYREIKEPAKYLQKGGIKQMCAGEPYEVEHAYGLVYDYEEEKVAPTFSGAQFQVYLDRATELCDDDPKCNYFNLWTDGGITKYSECDSLKDTVNSTLTYEKIPPPPLIGTECEDKGYKGYNWYDFKKGKVTLSTGAGEAKSEWNEDGDCVRVSCKNSEREELNPIRQCIPTTIEQLSTNEQILEFARQKQRREDVDAEQAEINKKKEFQDACVKHFFDTALDRSTNTFKEEVIWNPSGNQGYVISKVNKIIDCRNSANTEYDRTGNKQRGYAYFDGFADDWGDNQNDADASWW